MKAEFIKACEYDEKELKSSEEILERYRKELEDVKVKLKENNEKIKTIKRDIRHLKRKIRIERIKIKCFGSTSYKLRTLKEEFKTKKKGLSSAENLRLSQIIELEEKTYGCEFWERYVLNYKKNMECRKRKFEAYPKKLEGILKSASLEFEKNQYKSFTDIMSITQSAFREITSCTKILSYDLGIVVDEPMEEIIEKTEEWKREDDLNKIKLKIYDFTIQVHKSMFEHDNTLEKAKSNIQIMIRYIEKFQNEYGNLEIPVEEKSKIIDCFYGHFRSFGKFLIVLFDKKINEIPGKTDRETLETLRKLRENIEVRCMKNSYVKLHFDAKKGEKLNDSLEDFKQFLALMQEEVEEFNKTVIKELNKTVTHCPVVVEYKNKSLFKCLQDATNGISSRVKKHLGSCFGRGSN